MKNYFNDSPIEDFDDDEYGVSAFAEALANSILKIKDPVGTTIALNGPWGSGKSSVVNLIRSSLAKAKSEKLVVTEFKCWWYRGEEALALAFLQNLNAVLGSTLKDKVKDLVPRMGRGLLQGGPIVGAAMALTPAAPLAGMVGGVMDFAKQYFPDGDTVEANFQKLSTVLANEDRRFLVIIDDIDRLDADEALAIFRLIKSVGRLPNVMYLVVFDRQIAERAINDRHPSEGPHFLEKIIQAGFELPPPLPVDLNNATMASIQEICGLDAATDNVRFMNLFYDIVVPYVTSPRHVSRLRNSMSVTWPAIRGEVNAGDYMALETLRLYEPTLFNAIRGHRNTLCGVRTNGLGSQDGDGRFTPFLEDIPLERHEVVRAALQRLFPKMEATGYDGSFLRIWKSERRVCHEAYFDTYFRLSLSDEILSKTLVQQLIEKSDDQEFIRDVFRRAASTWRRNGQSMVPVYLDELTANAERVPPSNVMPLLSALFELHDEIDLPADGQRGFGGIANTSLQYHWLIRRLTERRFNIGERTELYLAALEHASLGWLVDFAASAIRDYQPREGKSPAREEDCLTTVDAIEVLKDKALRAIRAAAADGSLTYHKDLLYILYRWSDVMGRKPEEVRAFTDSCFADKRALAALARAMTGRSWSMGMGWFGGLGDRVSKSSPIAQVFRQHGNPGRQNVPIRVGGPP